MLYNIIEIASLITNLVILQNANYMQTSEKYELSSDYVQLYPVQDDCNSTIETTKLLLYRVTT